MVDEWHLIDHLLPAHLHAFQKQLWWGEHRIKWEPWTTPGTFNMQYCSCANHIPGADFVSSEQRLSVTEGWTISLRKRRFCFLSPKFTERSNSSSSSLLQPGEGVKARCRCGPSHSRPVFILGSQQGVSTVYLLPRWIPRTLGATKMLIWLLI